MKKCKKCGAVQENDNTVCIDCGAVLGAPVDDATESELVEEISDKVESMSESVADFYVSKKDKIIGCIAIVFAIASIIMMAIMINALERIDGVSYDELYVVEDGVLSNEPAKAITALKDRYQQSALWFLGSAMFSAGAAIFFLAPKFLWWSYTWRIRYIANIERLEPSASYVFSYKCGKYIPFFVGCILFAVALIFVIPMI